MFSLENFINGNKGSSVILIIISSCVRVVIQVFRRTSELHKNICLAIEQRGKREPIFPVIKISKVLIVLASQ